MEEIVARTKGRERRVRVICKERSLGEAIEKIVLCCDIGNMNKHI